MALTRFNAERDGEALSDAYDRGVRDTLARLTGPEAIRAACVNDALRYARQDVRPPIRDDEAVDVYGIANEELLSAVAAALAPRPEEPFVTEAQRDGRECRGCGEHLDNDYHRRAGECDGEETER